ncbi:MAG: hypothetical protein PVJ57_00715 [Phycisphaerae bacterium]|jgi:hypothetical protein
MRPDEFEAYVRRLAKVRWPGASGGSETLAGSQIDGVLRLNDRTYLVEATIERDMEKVRADMNKLVAAKREEGKTAFVVEPWMVMLVDPTPQQRQLARSSGVSLVSAEEFSEPVLCRTEYQHLRPLHSFGSAADPLGKVATNDLPRYATPILLRSASKDVDIDWIVAQLRAGKVVILLGDFGAGKSLTTRDVYRRLESDQTLLAPFPVAINLREHWGQESPDEVFLRHAQKLGSIAGLQLFRAWQEGFITLLLDGFDEVAPQPWAYDRLTLDKVRRKALTAVRRILEQRPSKCGVLISGRTHYFPSEEELCQALDISPDAVTILELRELAANEAATFLKQYNIEARLSRWLPRRPLLLSYLAQTGYINEITGIVEEDDVGDAWRQVINMICGREAKIATAMDKDAIVGVLASLAHVMRREPQILGPIADTDLEHAFRLATGHQPDQDAWTILQRLPGITFRGEGRKWFVDEEWADALAGMGIARLVRGVLNDSMQDQPIRHPLGTLGQMVASSVLCASSAKAKDLVTWAHESARHSCDPTLLADAVCTSAHMAGSVSYRELVIANAFISAVVLDDWSIRDVTFEDCCFDLLSIGSASAPDGVRFVDCLIGVLDGASQQGELPTWLHATVLRFNFPNTNAEVMEMAVPDAVKLGIIVLRKVYLQHGRGRNMSALLRGIDPGMVALARRITTKLERQGWLSKRSDGRGNFVVHPVRARNSEVRSLLLQMPNLRAEPWASLAATS